ncbi:hypothetical protein DSM3645_03238 [Blastopirellula marina DSM 3645]|uniref:Uncharacterized protein n=1 Tax=Blastopirellula marina DSM 3645 TaxID=314230 RepID=A3ZVW1_9BACT|nr:hypothetical protein DSM3645_03238 [Blastopirellula marina DSM 3645]
MKSSNARFNARNGGYSCRGSQNPSTASRPKAGTAASPAGRFRSAKTATPPMPNFTN